MKIIPVLFPTEDASPLCIHKGKLMYVPTQQESRAKNFQNQHIFLCSNQEPKEDNWCIRIANQQIFKWTKALGSRCSDEIGTEVFKIEFTNNSNLIADGIPEIDGNTKALAVKFGSDWKNRWAEEIEVNFLEELVRRYNDKKEHICIQTGMPCGMPCYSGCPLYDKDGADAKILQSTGVFSSNQVFDAIAMARKDTSVSAKEIIHKIQFPTKPQGEIKIRLEMEELGEDWHNYPPNTFSKIKLKDGKPIIHFDT